MEKIPIFLSSDNNYAPFVATTIASTCDNTKSFCDFYILDGGITKENQEKICELKKQFNNFSIEFIKIDTKKCFNGFKENLHFSKAMYSRFLIPELKPEIDKVIYSDVDVIVMGNIKEIYDEDINDFLLGAVPEYFLTEDEIINRRSNLKISDNHLFFASGNLLINCKKWRIENISKELLNLTLKKNEILTYPDQDILNIYFDNKYKELPVKYCYTQQYCNKLDMKNIVIRHFNTELKPWHISEDYGDDIITNSSDFWKYLKMTTFYTEISSKAETTTALALRHAKIIKAKNKIQMRQTNAKQ